MPATIKLRRLPRLAAMAIAGTAAFCGGLDWWLDRRAEAKLMTLDQALWVTDWDVTRIYAPGTAEQRAIVAQFRASGGSASKQRFQAPLLYRMGASASGDPSEGIIITPFDPSRPEMASMMKAGTSRSSI